MSVTVRLYSPVVLSVENDNDLRSYSPWKTTMTSGQDVSEYLDTLGLVKIIFFRDLTSSIFFVQ